MTFIDGATVTAARAPRQRYSSVAIALHWIIAAALVLQVVLGWRMAGTSGSQRVGLLLLHKSIGITILLLVVARLFWRLRRPPPDPDPGLKPWERLLSTAVHRTFYAILFALPLTGWALISASRGGATTKLFGLLQWPRLPWFSRLPAAVQDAVSGFLDGSHQALAWVLVALVALHVIGAFRHQLVARDRVLSRMAPWIPPATSSLVRLSIIPLVGLLAVAAAYAPRPEEVATSRPKPTELARADIFLDAVQPALAKHCESCHNDEKSRGGLSVQSYEALMEGGLHGHTVVAGMPAASEILRRIRLPGSDEQHMPRNGHVPLNAAQVRTIEWWIARGAPSSAPIAEIPLTPELRTALLAVLHLRSEEAMSSAAGGEDAKLPVVAAADPQAVAALESSDFVVRQMAKDSNLLDVDHVGPQPLSEAQFRLLDAVAPEIAALDLRKVQLPNGELSRISRMNHLRHLRLEWNPIDDAGAAMLGTLTDLRYLNMTGSRITDRGLDALSRLPQIREIAVWSSEVTPAGIEAVKKNRPDLVVEGYTQFSALTPDGK